MVVRLTVGAVPGADSTTNVGPEGPTITEETVNSFPGGRPKPGFMSIRPVTVSTAMEGKSGCWLRICGTASIAVFLPG